MTIEMYKSLKEVLCEEINIQEIQEIICNTEKGYLAICYKTDPYWHRYSSELFIRLGGERLDKPKLLKALIEAM